MALSFNSASSHTVSQIEINRETLRDLTTLRTSAKQARCETTENSHAKVSVHHVTMVTGSILNKEFLELIFVC